MTDQAMTDEQRLMKLNEMSTVFIEDVKKLGVEESLLGLIMPVTHGCELRVRVNGGSVGIVNMVSAIIQQLIPTDFHTLVEALRDDPAFGLQRDPTPIDKRHVN